MTENLASSWVRWSAGHAVGVKLSSQFAFNLKRCCYHRPGSAIHAIYLYAVRTLRREPDFAVATAGIVGGLVALTCATKLIYYCISLAC